MQWNVRITIGNQGQILYELTWMNPVTLRTNKIRKAEINHFLAEHKNILFDQQYFLHPLANKTPCLCLWVAPGDSIKWVSTQPFAVHFDPLSPSGQIVLRGGSGTPATCTILDNVPYGRYSCFVAVYREKVVYTDDPDIIVDPRRTKGP